MGMMVVDVGVGVGVAEDPAMKLPKPPPRRSPLPMVPVAGVALLGTREMLPASPFPVPASCT
jgi:hypothetical protein